MPYIRRCECCCANGFWVAGGVWSPNSQACAFQGVSSGSLWFSTTQNPFTPWGIGRVFGYDWAKDLLIASDPAYEDEPSSPVLAWRMRRCRTGEPGFENLGIIPYRTLISAEDVLALFTAIRADYDSEYDPPASDNALVRWLHADPEKLYGVTRRSDNTSIDIWSVNHDGSGLSYITRFENEDHRYWIEGGFTISFDGEALFTYTDTEDDDPTPIHYAINGVSAFTSEETGGFRGAMFLKHQTGGYLIKGLTQAQFGYSPFHVGAYVYGSENGDGEIYYGVDDVPPEWDPFIAGTPCTGIHFDPITGATYMHWSHVLIPGYSNLGANAATVSEGLPPPGDISFHANTKFLVAEVGRMGGVISYINARPASWGIGFAAGGPCGKKCPECQPELNPDNCAARTIVNVGPITPLYEGATFCYEFQTEYTVAFPVGCTCTYDTESVEVSSEDGELQICVDVTCIPEESSGDPVTATVCGSAPHDCVCDCCDSVEKVAGTQVTMIGWPQFYQLTTGGYVYQLYLFRMNVSVIAEETTAEGSCSRTHAFRFNDSGDSGDYDDPGVRIWQRWPDGFPEFLEESYLYKISVATTCPGNTTPTWQVTLHMQFFSSGAFVDNDPMQFTITGTDPIAMCVSLRYCKHFTITEGDIPPSPGISEDLSPAMPFSLSVCVSSFPELLEAP